MEIYVIFSFISIFSLFSLFKYDFIRCVNFTVSQLQTQQVMTSQIRSRIEYLIHTYHIIFLILWLKLRKNLASLTVFNTI